MSSLRTGLVTAAVCGVACGSDPTPAPGDAAVDAGALPGPDAAAADAAMLADAGSVDRCALSWQEASGANGPIAGWVVVYAADSTTDAPIAGAVLVVGSGSMTSSAATDARGCASVEDPLLDGEAAIHVFAAGFSPVSRSGYDRRAQRFVLTPEQGTPPPVREPGFLTGEITNLPVVLTTTSATEARWATVMTARPFAFVSPPQQPGRLLRPDILESDVVVGTGFAFSSYTLRVFPDAPVVPYVLGGVRASNGAIRLSHIGVAATTTVASGQTRRLGLELTHFLGQSVSYTLSNAPVLLQRTGIIRLIRLAEGSYLEVGNLLGNVWPRTGVAPALTGSLAGAVHAGLAFASDAAGTKVTYQLAHGDETSVVVDQWLEPPEAVIVAARDLSLSPARDADSCLLRLYDPASGRVLWTFSAFGDPNLFAFPATPAGLADPLTGTKGAAIDCYRTPGWDALEEPGARDAYLEAWTSSRFMVDL